MMFFLFMMNLIKAEVSLYNSDITTDLSFNGYADLSVSEDDPFSQMLLTVDKNAGFSIRSFSGEIMVYNIAGQLVKKIICEDNAYVPIGSKGIYIVKFRAGQMTKTIKIVL